MGRIEFRQDPKKLNSKGFLTTDQESILSFTSGYASPEKPQSIDEIQGDLQLGSLLPLINSFISTNTNSTILDVGCGNAILLAELSKLESFQRHRKIKYLGFDFSDKITGAFKTVVDLYLTSRSNVISLEDSNWTEYVTDPCVIVIRNVFHELEITAMAKLISDICGVMPPNSVMYCLDMTTLPVAEKLRAGWIGEHLKSIFEKGGLKVNLTSDTSKRGVNIYLLEGKRESKFNSNYSQVLNDLIKARKYQLSLLLKECESTRESPENQFKILRIKHDIAAIYYSLKKHDIEVPESIDYIDSMISTISLAFENLSDNDFEIMTKNYKYFSTREFQNRGRQITAVDDFLRSDKTIFVLKAGPYMGKKTLVWHVLEDKIEHEKLPIYLFFEDGTNLIYVVEEILSQLNLKRHFDVEILSHLKDLPEEQLKEITKKILRKILPKSILILDGIENCLDPNGRIEMDAIFWFIKNCSEITGSKVIIETRFDIQNLPFEKCEIHYMGTFPLGNKDKYLHAIQMLNKIVPVNYRICGVKHGGYPEKLLSALDNHPYFIYVAGTIIRGNVNSLCLKDNEFLDKIENRLYQSLISNFNLTELEKETLLTLVLVKSYFPLKIIEYLSNNESLADTLIGKGLLLPVFPGNFRTLSVLVKSVEDDYEDEVIHISQEERHAKLAEAFYHLYKIESDPFCFRQSFYHRSMAGERFVFNTYNLPELSACADSWYKLKKYADAKWAYERLKEERSLLQKEEMKYAGCLIRENQLPEGKLVYEKLIENYPYWVGVKYSYASSLLFVGKHMSIVYKLLNDIPLWKRENYWHLLMARCYRQMHRKNEAYSEYKQAIVNTRTANVWPIILEFTKYTHEIGDSEQEKNCLEYAWDLGLRSNDLKISLGSKYESINVLEKAYTLLSEVYEEEPYNPYCILPYVKTLCKKGETRKAYSLICNSFSNMEHYEVLVSAKIAYYKHIGNYPECEKLLFELVNLDTNDENVHKWGQWADLYNTWCKNLNKEDSIEKAKAGLQFIDKIVDSRNVPALMSCFELATIVGDNQLITKIKETTRSVNDSILFK